MTELAMNWVRGIWGREVLRRRIERLEDLLKRATNLLKDLRATNVAQGIAVLDLETKNKALLEAVTAWEEASKRIDPNAKCPLCGGTKGHLLHIPVIENGTCTDVVCQNNCEVCGNKFISSEAVAGRERAIQAYQPDVAPRTIQRTR
jgi:hypothetical protein